MTKSMDQMAPTTASRQPEAKSASFSATLADASQGVAAKPAAAQSTIAAQAAKAQNAQQAGHPGAESHIAHRITRPEVKSEQPAHTKNTTPVRNAATAQGHASQGTSQPAKKQPVPVDAAVLPRPESTTAQGQLAIIPAASGKSEIADKLPADARNARLQTVEASASNPSEAAAAGADKTAADAIPTSSVHTNDSQAESDAATQASPSDAPDAGQPEPAQKQTPDTNANQDASAQPKLVLGAAQNTLATQIESPAPQSVTVAQNAAAGQEPAAESNKTSADSNQALKAVQALAAGQAVANATSAAASATGLPAMKSATGAKAADAAGAKSQTSAQASQSSKAAASTGSNVSGDGTNNSAAAAQNVTPAQHVQQAQPADANANGAAAAQLQAAASSPAQTHDAAGSLRGGEGSVAPRAAVPTGTENLQPGITAGINASKLIQTMSTTEMHVGMRSAEFGDISIRTAVNAQQMMTQISVDHSDLSRAITAHLPQVQAKLAESFGLHASIEVHQSGMSFSSESGQQQQQERSRTAPRMTFDGAPAAMEPQAIPVRATPVLSSEYRLDIQA